MRGLAPGRSFRLSCSHALRQTRTRLNTYNTLIPWTHWGSNALCISSIALVMLKNSHHTIRM